MLLNNFLVLASREIENTNLFPFPFRLHLIFAVIAFVFFVFRFITDKRPFQLIFALAVPLSLSIWLSTSRTWFYVLGAIELALIILALVSCFIFKKEAAPAEGEKNAAEDAPEKED